jgi:PKD repeat protein
MVARGLVSFCDQGGSKMAEEKAPSRMRRWLKAVLTSLTGLLSGAVLMYISPLVGNTIKPAKPVANFGEQVQGLTVTFQNRATGATDGWWDFGDGSPLEPFSGTQEAVTHTYPHAGAYSVKLSLRNLLGEEGERTVPLHLDENGPPVIEAFKVDALKPEASPAGVFKSATAPATFKVASQVKNAELSVWSHGDSRPLEFSREASLTTERYVTFREPGAYTMRLMAVNGNSTVEKSETVVVEAGNSNAPTASLQVTYQAVRVKGLQKEKTFYVPFPADRKESTYPFTLTHVETDYQIIDAKFPKPVTDASVKNPTLAISADKSRLVLTGQLVRPGGLEALRKNQPPVKWTPTVSMKLESRSEPMLKTFDPITLEINVGGTTVLPLPPLHQHWEIKGTMVNLELLDGAVSVFKDSKLPAGAMVQFKGHPYRVSAKQAPDHIRLDVINARATLQPVAN